MLWAELTNHNGFNGRVGVGGPAALFTCVYTAGTLTDPNLGLTLTIPYSTRASPHYLTE